MKNGEKANGKGKGTIIGAETGRPSGRGVREGLHKKEETLPVGLEHTGGGTGRVSRGLFYCLCIISFFSPLSTPE